MFSCTLHNAFGVRVKLFFRVRRVDNRDECRNHPLISCHKVIEKVPAFHSLTLHIIRNRRRKVVVLILLSLPIGNIRFHGKELALSLLHRLVHRDRIGINRKHQTAVNIRQFGDKAVLDKVGVILEIQHPAVSAVKPEVVRAELH